MMSGDQLWGTKCETHEVGGKSIVCLSIENYNSLLRVVHFADHRLDREAANILFFSYRLRIPGPLGAD